VERKWPLQALGMSLSSSSSFFLLLLLLLLYLIDILVASPSSNLNLTFESLSPDYNFDRMASTVQQAQLDTFWGEIFFFKYVKHHSKVTLLVRVWDGETKYAFDE
jgi:hypothetical protein